MKNLLNIVYGLLIGLLAAGLLYLTTLRPRGEAVVLLPTSTPGLITVYVSGAVKQPGVYDLPLGSRIGDAIDLAGGFAVNALPDQINLAATVEDGEQIAVPGSGGGSQISLGRMDINTATAAELDSLPGIGPTAAESIVEYRTENGPFHTIQEIMNVPGIGPATYDAIKDLIMVGP